MIGEDRLVHPVNPKSSPRLVGSLLIFGITQIERRFGRSKSLKETESREGFQGW